MKYYRICEENFSTSIFSTATSVNLQMPSLFRNDFRSRLKNKFPSTTVWMVRSRKIATSRCRRTKRVTRSTSSRAKCGKSRRSRCGTSCSSVNVGCRACCWWCTRRRYPSAISCCWPSRVTRGSRCRCPRPICSYRRSFLFLVRPLWTSCARSSAPLTSTCTYSAW